MVPRGFIFDPKPARLVYHPVFGGKDPLGRALGVSKLVFCEVERHPKRRAE